MKLTFLGTAAAEGYPAVWCRCDHCAAARQRRGRSLRFRSAMLVNEDLLVDAGPDIVASTIHFGIDLAPVQALLVTHPHTDHLDPSNVLWRRKGFCMTPLPPLCVYASRAALAKITQAHGPSLDLDTVRATPFRTSAFQRLEVCTGGATSPDERFSPAGSALVQTARRRYDVWTLGARHAEPDDEAMFFAIQQVEGPEVSGRPKLPAVLYATDTGPFTEETWSYLESTGVRFDATVIDATMGFGDDGTAHMNLRQMEAHQDELGRRGLLANGARRFAHHFSHGNTPPHDELEAFLAARTLQPTYDGLIVQL